MIKVLIFVSEFGDLWFLWWIDGGAGCQMSL